MDRSGFPKYFILGFFLFLGKGQEIYDGYRHKKNGEFVYGVLGQNVTLSCDLQSYCVRGPWACSTSPVKYLTARPFSDCGEFLFVSDSTNGEIKNTSLHINNFKESLAGIYDCNCHHENVTERVKRFNLQIKNSLCQLEITRNEKVKVFDNSTGSQRDEAALKVNVNIDDNITARCTNDGANLQTNCKNRI
ncbi:uncharacterized protein [Apostichopus japonicus]|uniref:uncharacterized protein n=1 Tax=Stichopus japonicus TaxID=307972 RepID=UPI003AB3285D